MKQVRLVASHIDAIPQLPAEAMEQATDRNQRCERTESRISPPTIQPLAPCRMRRRSLFPLPRIFLRLQRASRTVVDWWLEMQEDFSFEVQSRCILKVISFQYAGDRVKKRYEVNRAR